MDPFSIATLIDAVIVVTLVECAALTLWHRFSSTGVAPREFALNVLSGLCLMFALRCLARDPGSAWIALFLLAAGMAHGADIVVRWRRAAQDTSTGATATATATTSESAAMTATVSFSAPTPSRAAPPAA